MPRFTFNRTDPEVDRAREALLAVVAGLRGELAENRRETAWLRDEVKAMRAELPSKADTTDVQTAVKAALDCVAGANQRVGILQQQIAGLSQPDAMITLAADLAEQGLLETLAVEAGGAHA